MKKIKLKFYRSYEEADKDILMDSLAMSPEERLAAVNIIRSRLYKLKGYKANNIVKKVISYGKR